MARVWTCRCGVRSPRIKQKCPEGIEILSAQRAEVVSEAARAA